MLVLRIIQTILANIAIFIGAYMATGIWIGQIKNVKLIKKVNILSLAYLVASFVLLMIAY